MTLEMDLLRWSEVMDVREMNDTELSQPQRFYRSVSRSPSYGPRHRTQLKSRRPGTREKHRERRRRREKEHNPVVMWTSLICFGLFRDQFHDRAAKREPIRGEVGEQVEPEPKISPRHQGSAICSTFVFSASCTHTRHALFGFDI
jgi:hypothetical protein